MTEKSIYVVSTILIIIGKLNTDKSVECRLLQQLHFHFNLKKHTTKNHLKEQRICFLTVTNKIKSKMCVDYERSADFPTNIFL